MMYICFYKRNHILYLMNQTIKHHKGKPFAATLIYFYMKQGSVETLLNWSIYCKLIKANI